MTERKARRLLAERSDGLCELRIDGVCLGRATNVQHRRSRAHKGPWELSNLVHVCGSGTTGCHGYIHGNPNEATDEGWTVKSWEDWQTKPVLTWWGYVVLDNDGGWLNLGSEKPREEHTLGCTFWHSDLCDCGGGAVA